MNILYIDHYAGSPGMGMEYRPYQMARHWSEVGDRVTILAAGYSHLRRKNPELGKKWERRVVDGQDFLFVKTPPYRGNGWGRAWNIGCFVGSVTGRAKTLARILKPDVVIASSTYPFDIYPALRIASCCGAGVVYEIHDLWPLTPIELYGYHPCHPAMLLMAGAERRAMLSSDMVVSILPRVDRYMEERGYDTGKFLYIPNGFEMGIRPPDPRTKAIMELLQGDRAGGRFSVVYAGSMAPQNCLKEFVLAAERLGEAAQFTALGSGGQREALIRLAKRRRIRNIRFLNPVARDQLQWALSLADCLYIGAKKSPLYRYGVGMNKLSDYMLAARPILYGVQASNNPVRDAGCGLTIAPQSSGALAAGVRQLMGTPVQKRLEMGACGRDYVWKHHNLRILAEDFRQGMLRL